MDHKLSNSTGGDAGATD